MPSPNSPLLRAATAWFTEIRPLVARARGGRLHRRRQTPALERLEGRAMLTYTFTWTGGAHDGYWDDAKNWSNDTGDPAAIPVPSDGDNVVIGPDSGTIVCTDSSASSLSCGAGTTLKVIYLEVSGGMTLDGAIVLANWGLLDFRGSQTLSGSGGIAIGQPATNSAGTLEPNQIQIQQATGSSDPATLVIGPHITIAGDSAYIGSDIGSNNNIINQGTIVTDGEITIGYNDYDKGVGLPSGYFVANFTNQGTIETTGSGTFVLAATNQKIGGTLDAEGGKILVEHSVVTGPSATFKAANGGEIDYAATIDNSGNTIALDDAGGSFVSLEYMTNNIVNGVDEGNRVYGMITGGTIVAQSAGSDIGGEGTLDNVALNGNFDEKDAGLTIRDGFSIDGNLTIEAGEFLFMNTLEILGFGEIDLGSAGNSDPARITMGSDTTGNGTTRLDSTLTLGPGITVSGPNGQISGGSAISGSTATLINYGIIPDVQNLDIVVDSFVNQGYVGCTGVGDIRSAMFNSGHLAVSNGGSLAIVGLTNYGTVTVSSGSLNPSDFAQSGSGVLNLTLNGTSGYAQVNFQGAGPMAIGGTLNIVQGEGFHPANGARFLVVTYQPSGYYYKLATKRGHPLAIFDNETGLTLASGGQLKSTLAKNALVLTATVPKAAHKPTKGSGHKHG